MIAVNIIGVSRLIIENDTIVLKNCNIVSLKFHKRETSVVSISLENLLRILPIGVVSEEKKFRFENFSKMMNNFEV